MVAMQPGALGVQVGLVREVVVQRRLGDARRPRDIGHRDVAEALGPKQRRRRRQDPIAPTTAAGEPRRDDPRLRPLDADLGPLDADLGLRG